jgi:hypothetical protein
MKSSLYLLAFSFSLLSCIQSQNENSIVEFYGVNDVVVFLKEPSSSGDRIHFLRLDCKNPTGKMRKCIEVPLADGTVKEAVGNGRYKVQLDPGGRIEAFAIVRKHNASDRH